MSAPEVLLEQLLANANVPAWEETGFAEKLATAVNYLIDKDFERLLFILYRVDVSESKLKTLLATHPGEDAGIIIANLLIERQQQKIKMREAEKNKRSDTTDEEEKW